MDGQPTADCMEGINLEEQTCCTRYPILLIHGTGFRDWKGLGYWGRIPKALERHGARIFFGGQDAWATVEENAAHLKKRVQQILEQTGCQKVNIIAHSKGGLEARYLVSSLGMGPYVASVTLISTPNHGSKTMDLIFRLPQPLLRLAGIFVNGWFRFIGDRHPDFCSACVEFTTSWAKTFNLRNPDVPGVLYRSYAGVMSSFCSDLFMWWQNLIISLVEGRNDGLVTVDSAVWTNFKGVWQGAGGRGVSHMDKVDFRRRPIIKGGQTWDVVDEYLKMAAELKDLGL